jgi:hypothetical protein
MPCIPSSWQLSKIKRTCNCILLQAVPDYTYIHTVQANVEIEWRQNHRRELEHVYNRSDKALSGDKFDLRLRTDAMIVFANTKI